MWIAKPSGAYDIESVEAKNNMFEIKSILEDSFTIEAICGILGNMVHESGLNPWRWQGDTYGTGSKKGYGLAQFTPAVKTADHGGYIGGYGVRMIGYSPNLSPNGQTEGATYEDGKAQTYVIKNDVARKYIDRRSWCTYWDLSNTYPFSEYKQLTDLKTSTIAWLFNYEAPADRSEDVANARYASASRCYEIITGSPPPTPPTPPIPPSPTPIPPSQRKKMSLYMYTLKRHV
jgi:hypothetical protein